MHAYAILEYQSIVCIYKLCCHNVKASVPSFPFERFYTRLRATKSIGRRTKNKFNHFGICLNFIFRLSPVVLFCEFSSYWVS